MVMNCLKIENGKGYFRNTQNQMQEVDGIRKEDILHLLDLATNSDVDFEMDEIEGDNIKNQAHKVIYESLFRKFKEFLENKARFIDESENLDKDAMQKYKSD